MAPWWWMQLLLLAAGWTSHWWLHRELSLVYVSSPDDIQTPPRTRIFFLVVGDGVALLPFRLVLLSFNNLQHVAIVCLSNGFDPPGSS